MEPLISVIVPVYNVEKYLGQCLEDIVNQTYNNIEIIVVDDGATDSSGKLCDQWQHKDSRIVVYHKENGGLSDARNYGLKFAKGEWVTFVDSDDRVAENFIEKLYENALKYKAEISICDPLHIFDDKMKFDYDEKIKIFSADEAIEEMWYQKSFLVSAWGKLYKRKFFEKVLFKKGIIFEDVEIMHKIFEQADKIVYSTTKLYGYVHREGSITTQKFSVKDCGILDICEELLKYTANKSQNLKDAAKAYYVVGCFRIYLNAPIQDEYKKYINKAKDGLNKYGKDVLKSSSVRKKTKLGLICYFYLPFLMLPLYRRINRWK